MDDLLTTREVLDLLKVDRITVYRMLQDGRLKGVKIGQQWRFHLQEVEHLLGKTDSQLEPLQPEINTSFPSHCVQTIQDLFSEVGQVSGLVVDVQGEPLTEVSRLCRFCQVIRQNPNGRQACQASWKEFARQSAAGSRYFTCHAGVQYISAPILDSGTPVGYFLAGEFYWQAAEAQEEANRIQRLAASYLLPVDTLQQAARTIPVIAAEQQSRVETWPQTAARAVESILGERSSFTRRLQQIADLTQIR